MLKQLVEQILGGTTTTGEVNAETSSTLSDENYEFLWLQLLEGVAHGWQPARIQKFFDGLGARGETSLWIDWLNRYGKTLLAASNPNRQLAQEMLRLREHTKHIPQLKELGETAQSIGRSILTRDQINPIWEYDGPDAPSVVSSGSGDGQLTLQELFERLQQDSSFLAQVAQQLGVEDQKPEVVMATLQEQIQNLSQNTEEIANPQSAEDWFNKGLQQINNRDFEGAIAFWDQALELQPDFAEAWHNRGSALGYLERYEEALKSYEKVLEYQPDNLGTWLAHGRILETLGRPEDAIASYDQVLTLKPDHLEATKSREKALTELQAGNN